MREPGARQAFSDTTTFWSRVIRFWRSRFKHVIVETCPHNGIVQDKERPDHLHLHPVAAVEARKGELD